MNGTVSRARRVVSLVLAVVLVLPVMSVSTAYAADTPFTGGPQVGYAPTVVPNDHTPLAVRFSGSSLEASSTYYVKVRLTLNPDPATGGGGSAHRGFIWNKVTGEWVPNRGVAWDRYPTIQTDGSGNVIATNDANWLFFKFGNENNTGTYYLNITLNKGGVDGQSRNSDTPLAVQVVDMKTAGAWLHNGTASGADRLQAGHTQLVRRELLDRPGHVDLPHRDQHHRRRLELRRGRRGLRACRQDRRLAARGVCRDDRRRVHPDEPQSGVGGNDFVMGHADQDIALGAADQSAPTSPTALTATSADGKVTLDWDAATDNVGVAKYNIYRWVDTNAVEYTSPHVCIDTTTATTYEDTSVTGGVLYNYEVRAVDEATNVSARSDKVTVEALPPIPTVSAAAAPSAPNGSGGWYIGAAPTITLTSAATAKYAWDSPGGPFTTYAAPLTAPEGVHTLYYYAEDTYGQTSAVADATFKVDTVKPTASVSAPYLSTDQSTTRKFTVYLSSTTPHRGPGPSRGTWTRRSGRRAHGRVWRPVLQRAASR